MHCKSAMPQMTAKQVTAIVASHYRDWLQSSAQDSWFIELVALNTARCSNCHDIMELEGNCSKVQHQSNHNAEASNTHHHHCGPHRCAAFCRHCALQQNSPPHCPYQMPQQPPSALACQCLLGDHTKQCMQCSQCHRLPDGWCAHSQCTWQYQRL